MPDAPPGSAPSAPDQPGRSAAAEQRALAAYAARLRPAVQAGIAAAQAAGAAGRPFTGAAQAILTTAGLGAVTEGIISAVSLAALDRWTRQHAGTSTTSRSRRAALWEVREPAASAGSTAGAKRLADALRDISRSADQRTRQRAAQAQQVVAFAPGETPIPSPGTATQLKPPYVFTDADGLARAVAVSTKEAARHHAAVAAGWPYKTWMNVKDNRVRVTHDILGSRGYDNHKVPVGVPFLSPSGAKLDFPGDPSAPLDETIHCRCWLLYTAP